MLSDIAAVVWKEWREVLRMGGSTRRAVLRQLFSIGLLGVIWPWQLGPRFVTSSLGMVFAAFTAAMYVAGVVPDSFAGERERHTLETLLASRLPDRAILFGKIATLVMYGLGAAVVMLTFGWATVNIVHRDADIVLYDASTLIGAIVFSLIGASFMGAVGVLVSLRAATVKQAQQVLTTSVLILLFVPIIALPTMPAEWRDLALRTIARWGATTIGLAFAAAILIAQVLLYAIAIARFTRPRLVLEK